MCGRVPFLVKFPVPTSLHAVSCSEELPHLEHRLHFVCSHTSQWRQCAGDSGRLMICTTGARLWRRRPIAMQVIVVSLLAALRSNRLSPCICYYSFKAPVTSSLETLHSKWYLLHCRHLSASEALGPAILHSTTLCQTNVSLRKFQPVYTAVHLTRLGKLVKDPEELLAKPQSSS